MIQNMGGFMGGLAYFTMGLGFIKSILEVLFYMATIIVSFKAIQALNIYINKNS